MSRRTIFIPYHPKSVLNKGPRADHWFWSRYSAYPYLGCQHGCAFCYCREKKFSPYDDPQDFAYVIKVKENAPQLLRRGLQRAALDVVFTGDYQPAERKFGLSRQLLEVCLELGFPVLVLERSPLVLRDLDLLQEIQRRARAVVMFSIIYTPETPAAGRVRSFERLAPGVERRFAAMERLAAAGITTGVSAMPLLPGLCDTAENLDLLAHWTANHGGAFILASGLTLADRQREHFFQYLQAQAPELVERYARWYPPGSYGAAGGYRWLETARQVRQACLRHGILDRMPRPVVPGEKRALNKRAAERLADEAYRLDLEGKPAQAWRFRKAAWAMDDLPQELGLLYRTLGARGIAGIPGVGEELAGEVVAWLQSPARAEQFGANPP
ncbi:MAG: radical SAM protein [Chloroflexota bacterium]